MAQGIHIELDLDGLRMEALQREALRLGVPQDEIVRRAVAAWLVDMADSDSVGRESPSAEA